MSMVGKAGYKETAIGWLPNDWCVSSIENVGTVIRGASPRPQGDPRYYGGAVPRLMGADVTRDGKWVTPKIDFLTEEGAKKSRPCSKGTLTIICSGDVGIPSFLAVDACIHDGFLAITEIDESIANKDYLYHIIFSLKQRLDSSATHGGVFTNLTTAIVKEFQLPLPPLPEQEKIAAILSAVDDKLDVIARQIAATNTLKRGLMQTLFSQGVGTQDANGQWHPHTEFQQTELGEIPAGWSMQPLGALAAESRKRNAGELDDDKLCGVLKSDGLVPMRERVKGTSTDRCRLVEADAFAYNPMRINIGSIARNLQNQTVMVSPDYVVFSTKPQVLSADFLDHFRRSGTWERFVGRSGDGGVRIRIYFDDLAQLKIATPPLSEQLKIAEVLDGINAKIAALTNKQTHYQTLKRGLMQKLLTGEWRVKVA